MSTTSSSPSPGSIQDWSQRESDQEQCSSRSSLMTVFVVAFTVIVVVTILVVLLVIVVGATAPTDSPPAAVIHHRTSSSTSEVMMTTASNTSAVDQSLATTTTGRPLLMAASTPNNPISDERREAMRKLLERPEYNFQGASTTGFTGGVGRTSFADMSTAPVTGGIMNTPQATDKKWDPKRNLPSGNIKRPANSVAQQIGATNQHLHAMMPNADDLLRSRTESGPRAVRRADNLPTVDPHGGVIRAFPVQQPDNVRGNRARIPDRHQVASQSQLEEYRRYLQEQQQQQPSPQKPQQQ